MHQMNVTMVDALRHNGIPTGAVVAPRRGFAKDP
jgi:hypothetical protein